MDTAVYVVIDGSGQPIEMPDVPSNSPSCAVLEPSELTVFSSVNAARDFLLASGHTEKQLSGYRYLRSVGTCSRCGSPLFKSLVPVDADSYDVFGDGYEYRTQCFCCDEDFYGFEQQDMLDERFAALPEIGALAVPAI